MFIFLYISRFQAYIGKHNYPRCYFSLKSRIAELLELGEGVIAMEPAEVLGEVAHSDIERCSIEQRPVFMKGIELDIGGSFISDLFIQTGSLFNPSQKITLR